MERIFIGIKVPKVLTSPISHLYLSNLADRRYQKNCRWVEDELHHITLTFIGGVTTEKREVIQRALREIKFSSFSLKLHHEINTFPHGAKRNLSVLHLPVYSAESNNNYSSELENLKESIDKVITICETTPIELSSEVLKVSPNPTADEVDTTFSIPTNPQIEDSVVCNEEGPAPSKRKIKRKHEKYHPHLTLSRVKQHSNVSEIFQIIEELNNAMKNTAEIPWNQMDFPVTQFVLFRSSLSKAGAVYEVIEEYNCT